VGRGYWKMSAGLAMLTRGAGRGAEPGSVGNTIAS